MVESEKTMRENSSLEIERFTKLYHYTSYESALKMIIGNSLKVTDPLKTNDPFECMPNYFNTEGQRVSPEDFQKVISNYIHFICFSENPNSSAMWSHYSQRHKGVLFEFSFGTYPFKELQDMEMKARRVTYDNRRVVFEEAKYLAADKKEQHEMVMSVLSRKEESWAYENEVRLFILAKIKTSMSEGKAIVNDGDDHFLQFDSNSIRSIYCGAHMTDIDFKNLKELVKMKWRDTVPHELKVEKVELSEKYFGFKKFE